MRRLLILISVPLWTSLLLQLPPQAVGSTPVSVTAAAPPTANPVLQLGRYVVDSLVRARDGTVQLYTNHRRCNEIRDKQRRYRLQHPNSAKLKPHLGITFQEFMFLQQGKEDRGKLANVIFMMVFAPNFVPYAFMFFPDMLPSPFATRPPDSFTLHTRRPLALPGTTYDAPSQSHTLYKYSDSISRQQTHVVIQTLLQLEKNAHTPPFFANLNPFGKDKVKQHLQHLDQWNDQLALFLARESASSSSSSKQSSTKPTKDKKMVSSNPTDKSPSVLDTDDGPHKIMKSLHTYLYNKDSPHPKNHLQLTSLPKTILSALDQLLSLSSTPANSAQIPTNTVASWLPKFITRGKVLNYLKQIEEADEFLIDSKTALDTIPMDLLQSTCQKRLMGGPDRSEEELRQALSTWLDCTVVLPRKRLKKASLAAAAAATTTTIHESHNNSAETNKGRGLYYFNGNLARVALLCYNALQGAKDSRNASYLPRLLFQSQ